MTNAKYARRLGVACLELKEGSSNQNHSLVDMFFSIVTVSKIRDD